MATITINYWLLLFGAGAGLAGALVARGRNRLIKAALAGAVTVFALDLLRGWL